jgi:hypothetical protein
MTEDKMLSGKCKGCKYEHEIIMCTRCSKDGLEGYEAAQAEGPGPHVVGPLELGFDDGDGVPIITFEARDIARLEEHYGDAEANGLELVRRYNAFPKLLEACEAIADLLLHLARGDDYCSPATLVEANAKVRAAIALCNETH